MHRMLATALVALAVTAAAAPVNFTLEDYLGHAWPTDTVHRTVTVPEAGAMTPKDAVLIIDGKAVASQLDKVETYPDGSLLRADVWFRTDLPAKGKRVCELRKGDGSPVPGTDLRFKGEGGVLELSNTHTAVRLPFGTSVAGDAGPAPASGPVPCPVLGIRLPSGAWTAAASTKPAGPANTRTITGTMTVCGPIFCQAEVVCEWTKDGQDVGKYTVVVALRADEPLVRVDERYDKAGTVTFDLSTGLQPTRFATKADFRGNMQLTPIAYEKANTLPSLVGWDFYLPDRTSVIGYLGGPHDDLLAWLGTEGAAATWLPEPYKQMFTVTAEPGGKLCAVGSLEKGRRTWGFMVGKGSDFPETPPGTPGNPGRDLYRWWTQHCVVSLDKVVNWDLVWPDMDTIAFPHTYFSAADLPGIRARLQAEPAIKDYMEELRKSDGGYLGWSNRNSDAINSKDDAVKDRFGQYEAKFKARGGIAQGMAQISAGYLYFGDHVYLEQMADRSGAGDQTPQDYLDFFISCYLDGAGPLWRAGSGGDGGQMGSMNVSDQMLLRCVAFDLLLGSDVLTPAERREMLSKLAFMVYVMHEPEWQPPVHMPDGSRPEGYGQGTPNQKHCAFSVRAMTACMLSNHPMKKPWLEFAMAELRPHYQYTINESGALLESPFYSSRDTMRYAPFWSAMVRAGIKDIAPDYEQWMNRPKRAFQYLADMLTPKEPRMGGKRVYHPIGRSAPGVIDPTLMIGADPWGLSDPQHGALMRWAWQEQGKPSPDIMGATGGRNVALTLLAFSHAFEPLKENPLRSRRWEGMGAVFRSHPEGDYESNVLFRHDGFCWDLYAVNNGAVYFYGKGAPLLPRFGGYWSHSYGGAWMMDMPFGNRVDFVSGNNSCFGSMTEFAALGTLADWAAGTTDDKHWTRSVLFAKDLDREDPVYLLVRDDVNRPDSASFLNWWVMTRNVQPGGLTSAGVVPVKISHENWVQNLGRNWRPQKAGAEDAKADAELEGKADDEEKPSDGINRLSGQFHHFPGMCGVDVDLFIATPTEPKIITDAASTGRFPYCANKDLVETQQLIRIEQPAGKGYLTLLTPRWPNSPPPEYRTLADGNGVAIKQPGGEDRLLLAEKTAKFADEVVTFEGHAGFARRAATGMVRLMVTGGTIAAGGITLTSAAPAALICDGKTVRVLTAADPKTITVTLPNPLKALPLTITAP